MKECFQMFLLLFFQRFQFQFPRERFTMHCIFTTKAQLNHVRSNSKRPSQEKVPIHTDIWGGGGERLL